MGVKLGPLRVCDSCKTEIELEWKYCSTCGKFIVKVCKRCGEKVKSNYTFCVGCGDKVRK